MNRCTGCGHILLAAALADAGVACSTIGPGSGGDDPDGGVAGDRAGAADAETALGPFSTPRLIDPLSSPGDNDDDPTVTGDRLELYFNSNRSGNNDLYVSRRDTVDEPWGDPERVPGLNTSNSETAPEVSRDGLTLHFSSNRPGGKGSQDIYITQRETRDDPWEPPDPVGRLNSAAADYSPVLDDSGLRVYFYSTRDGDQDLYTASRENLTVAWTGVTAIAELNTDGNDADPFISGDGLALLYGSGPPGVLDIYLARRLDRDGAFDPGEEVSELNSDDHETDPWLSPDGRYLVLTSDRSGDNEIYQSER